MNKQDELFSLTKVGSTCYASGMDNRPDVPHERPIRLFHFL